MNLITIFNALEHSGNAPHTVEALKKIMKGCMGMNEEQLIQSNYFYEPPVSGDGVRVAQPLFPVEGQGSIPMSPLQFEIFEIDRRIAVKLNALWHSRLPVYNTGFCLNSTVSYGLIYKNIYFAIAIWTNPVAQALPQKNWLELRRMAICNEAPKNTASRMLSIMAKMIKTKLPFVCNLISYQDVESHKGTIYKASGWKIGSHHRGGTWNRPNAKNSWNGKPRTRPDLNNAIGEKIRWEKQIRSEPIKTNQMELKPITKQVQVQMF